MTTGIQTDMDWRVPGQALPGIDEAFVQRVLAKAGEMLDTSGDVSISFVDDKEIHELNQTYRGIDRPTDVLSFALREGEPDVMADGEAELLGDIIVSIPTAIRQAEDYGHSVQREVAFLLVHGFLHLLGYDHQDADAEKEMFGLQEQVLAELGLSRSSATK